MVGVYPLVFSLAVMKKGKEFNHQQISPCRLANRKCMAAHPCPVTGAMHAVAADSKLGKHGFKQAASVKQRQVFRTVR